MKEGWKIVRLGEIGTFVRGGGFLKRDYVDNGYPCIHYGQIHMKLGVVTTQHITMIPESLAVKSKIASKGDIIIAITSEDVEGSCKSTAWMGNYDIAVGAHTAIFNHCQNPVFISYFFKSPQFNKYKAKYTRGFKVVEIKPSDIAKIEIPLPPLEEQHRIVSILDAAFAKIDALKKNAEENLKNAKALFQQVLAQELKPKEGWVEKKLSEIGDIQTGTTPDTKDKTNFGNFIPFVKPADVNYDGLGGLNYNNEGLSESGVSQSRLIKRKSVLMVCIGATISKTGYNTCDVTCNQQINTLTPYKDDYKYCYYAMIAPNFKYEILKEGNSHQTTLPIINKKKWSNLIISLPPLEEQHRIVHTLDTLSEKCRHLEQVAQQTIRECDALKQSILRRAFSGEL